MALPFWWQAFDVILIYRSFCFAFSSRNQFCAGTKKGRHGRRRIGNIGRGGHRHSRPAGPALPLLDCGQRAGHRHLLQTSGAAHSVQQVGGSYWRDKRTNQLKFGSSNFRFVLSLLSFNLVATTILLPLILMDSLIDVHLSYTHSTVDYAVCVAGQAVTTLVTTGSISAALVIAVDQYCAVMAPLHYHRRVTKTKAWLLLAGQWILAVAMSAFSLPDSAGKHFWKGCSNNGEALGLGGLSATSDDDQRNATAVEQPANQTLSGRSSWFHEPEEVWTMLFVSSSVLCYVVPLALLTWMYLRIYSAAHRNSQRTRRTSLTHSASELVVHCLGHGSSNSSPISGSLAQVSQLMSSSSCQMTGCSDSAAPMPSRTPSLRSTSSQIVHNLRYRISNASLFLYREEARAARVSVLVLVLVVCCWMPYHVLLALHGWAGWTHRLPSYAYHLTLVAVLINALSSPFLYAYRSRRIQREVRRLFGLPPKSRKGPHRHRDFSASQNKRRAKTLRSLSPRRQLLRKQVRGTDALSPDEVQAALSCNSRFSSTVEEPAAASSSAGVEHPARPELVRHLLVKMSRLWVQKPSAASRSSSTTHVAAPSVAADAELMAVTVDISRSSFSSATSSNSTSSAESDVSLWSCRVCVDADDHGAMMTAAHLNIQIKLVFICISVQQRDGRAKVPLLPSPMMSFNSSSHMINRWPFAHQSAHPDKHPTGFFFFFFYQPKYYYFVTTNNSVAAVPTFFFSFKYPALRVHVHIMYLLELINSFSKWNNTREKKKGMNDIEAAKTDSTNNNVRVQMLIVLCFAIFVFSL